jgi:hypothetical protein
MDMTPLRMVTLLNTICMAFLHIKNMRFMSRRMRPASCVMRALLQTHVGNHNSLSKQNADGAVQIVSDLKLRWIRSSDCQCNNYLLTYDSYVPLYNRFHRGEWITRVSGGEGALDTPGPLNRTSEASATTVLIALKVECPPVMQATWVRFPAELKIGPNFFLQQFNTEIIRNFVKFVAT